MEKTTKREDVLEEVYGSKEQYIYSEETEALWRETDPEDTLSVPTPSVFRKTVLDILCIGLNTFTTVVLVFVNKRVFSEPQFRNFQMCTAAWHFTVTTFVLLLASSAPFRIVQAVRLSILSVLPMSLLFVGFLVLGNLSLALNPVALYQVARILTTPTVVALNFLVFSKRITLPCLGAILISCAGVMITISDFEMSNQLGLGVAVASFVTTALYQIWIEKKIGSLDVSPAQLLLNQAPLSVVILLCMAPFFDVRPQFAEVDGPAAMMFLLSGLLAAGLNLSQFLIIGRTSALTFNIVSNIKNITIIALGWYQTEKELSMADIGGVSLAIAGASAYSLFCQRNKP